MFFPKGYLVIAQGMNGRFYALELNPKYHRDYGRFVAVEIEDYTKNASKYDSIGRKLHISPEDLKRPEDQSTTPRVDISPSPKPERPIDIRIRTGPEEAIASLLDEGRFAPFVYRWSLKRGSIKDDIQITVSIQLDRGIGDWDRVQLERGIVVRLKAYYKGFFKDKSLVCTFHYSEKEKI